MIGSTSLSKGVFVQLKSDPTIRGVIRECKPQIFGPFASTICVVALSETVRCTCGEHEDVDEMKLPSFFWEEVPN